MKNNHRKLWRKWLIAIIAGIENEESEAWLAGGGKYLWRRRRKAKAGGEAKLKIRRRRASGGG
jgi:hypothetical protein